MIIRKISDSNLSGDREIIKDQILATVVWTMDSAIHRIIHYPAEKYR